MSFLFVNTNELSALMGLPYIQQSAYLLGIRPYMDRKTFLVGERKRRISYKSLSEALYIEPHQGFEYSGPPSRPQLRRIIYALERAGLVEIKSIGKHLILKCILADSDLSVQNKPDTNPSHQPDTNPTSKNTSKSSGCDKNLEKPSTVKNLKPDTPHNSKDLFMFMKQQFAQFWSLYPLKQNQGKAWNEFTKLQPSAELHAQILKALQAQISTREEIEKLGGWIPCWKYPSNWLAQHSWNDELLTQITKEQEHASPKSYIRKKSGADILAESCKNARFDFDFDEDNNVPSEGNKVVPINRQQHER